MSQNWRMTERTLILDTMVFMHYPAFAKIPWTEMAGTEAVQLVLCEAVLSELDRHKDEHARKSMRDRVRKVLGAISQTVGEDGTGEVNPQVTLRLIFASEIPERIESEIKLDHTRADDQLLAVALTLRTAVQSIAIVSGDFTISLKAKRLGISLIEMPPHLRLKEPPDEVSRKLDEIRRDQLRRPQFEIRFLEGDGVTKSATLPILERGHVIDVGDMGFNFPGVSSEEMAKYRAASKRHEEESRRYEVQKARLLNVDFALANRGDSRGSSIKVVLKAPQGTRFFQEGHFPDAPEAPESPFKALYGLDQFTARTLKAIESKDIHIYRQLGRLLRKGEPKLTLAKKGSEAYLEMSELLHHFSHSETGLLLSVEDQSKEVAPIQVSIFCAELVEPKSLQLVVRIHNEPPPPPTPEELRRGKEFMDRFLEKVKRNSTGAAKSETTSGPVESTSKEEV